MVETITPVVHGGRRGRWGASVALHAVGAALGTTSRRMERVMARLDALGTSAVPRIVNGVFLVLLAVVAAVVAPGASGGEAGSFAAEVLAGVFAWAALAKAVRFRRWRSSLDAYRLPLPGVLAAAVPAAEAAITALVLLGRTRVAAVAALVLLAGFSMAVLRARRLVGDRIPCGCFGGRSRRDYRVLLARNAALVPVALAALSDPGIVTTPADVEVIPVALLVLGVVLLGLLMREVARLTPGQRGSRASV